jgi:hypothetical protein
MGGRDPSRRATYLQDDAEMFLRGREIYLDDKNRERAEAILESDVNACDEDELVWMSAQAYREATEQ